MSPRGAASVPMRGTRLRGRAHWRRGYGQSLTRGLCTPRSAPVHSPAPHPRPRSPSRRRRRESPPAPRPGRGAARLGRAEHDADPPPVMVDEETSERRHAVALRPSPDSDNSDRRAALAPPRGNPALGCLSATIVTRVSETFSRRLAGSSSSPRISAPLRRRERHALLLRRGVVLPSPPGTRRVRDLEREPIGEGGGGSKKIESRGDRSTVRLGRFT